MKNPCSRNSRRKMITRHTSFENVGSRRFKTSMDLFHKSLSYWLSIALVSNLFQIYRLSRRQNMLENEHGSFVELSTEKELMKLTTTSRYVVVHFFHKDFRRCDIMDKHLKVAYAWPASVGGWGNWFECIPFQSLAEEHYQTKFCKINVENAPFLVEKMHIRVLPCVMTFIDGIAQSK